MEEPGPAVEEEPLPPVNVNVYEDQAEICRQYLADKQIPALLQVPHPGGWAASSGRSSSRQRSYSTGRRTRVSSYWSSSKRSRPARYPARKALAASGWAGDALFRGRSQGNVWDVWPDPARLD